MIHKSVCILKSLRYPSGLFAAAKKSVGTGYDKSWLRDNIYESLGLEAAGLIDEVVATLRALLDALKKHEYKIDWAIKEKPQHKHQYIHARVDPLTFDEFHEDWGNKQNDAVGAILFKIGDLENKGVSVLRDDSDKRIVQKLVSYLASIEYWHDADNGMWEENEEVHASSVGACVAGLHAVSRIVDVPAWLIEKGVSVLDELLPCESDSKDVDLALLSLIYPYNIVDKETRDSILRNVEKKLVRARGVLRYTGDRYYHNGAGEAEWTMGFPWLAVIYKQMGYYEKYIWYMTLAESVVNPEGEMPELYYSGEARHNENTPLGWAQSLMIVAKA
ncbi:MAG: glycoside hydrolase family 15 protein [Nanoarchaeota archaeon]